MINKILRNLNKLDNFSKNVMVVFMGMAIFNFLNLVYQLMIAHKLSAADFATFNALLAVFTVIATPLGAFHASVTKFTSEFIVQKKMGKVKELIVNLGRISAILVIVTFILFYFASFSLIGRFKINSSYLGLVLASLIAISWISPVISGYAQGLELFKLITLVSVISGITKLFFGYWFIYFGFNITGALSGILISSLISLVVLFFPLKKYFPANAVQEKVNLKEVFMYQLPVAVSLFCFAYLVNFDMVLVKYYFSPADSGVYALGAMVGKVFLFLPVAITFVMFPKISGLKAQKMCTKAVLRRSIIYTVLLCFLAGLSYNIFPIFTLKVLSGKTNPDSLLLGRFFSFSMSFFTLFFLFINYFLSLKDLRFLKYLVIFTLLQFLGIVLFHKSLLQVQIVLCINSVFLVLVSIWLAFVNPENKYEKFK